MLLTHHDLATAYITAKEHHNDDPEVRDFHAQRLQIMAKLFGCDLSVIRDEDPNGDYDRTMVCSVAYSCIELACALYGPFDSFLEGKPGPLIMAIYSTRSDRFHDMRTQWDRECLQTLTEALVALTPEIATTTIESERLIECGLPREWPDPDDLW